MSTTTTTPVRTPVRTPEPTKPQPFLPTKPEQLPEPKN